MGGPAGLGLSDGYPETAELFRGWAVVRNLVDGPEGDYAARIPAVPPFYWHRFSDRYDALANVVARPPSGLFWRDEQAFYLAFARSLGYTGPAPRPSLPFCTAHTEDTLATTVVLAPGCKTGDMAAKRWPYFVELAARFEQVTVVGTDEDLVRFDGSRMVFPPHARVLAGHAGLHATADAIASAAVVVANDSGLGHLAAALGV